MEEVDEEFGTQKDATPSTNNNKDGKRNDKASATRSKHSVTEQRRRSKINERFQALKEIIPHSDQKRDTASFLLEVIQYVQYLQEKVQKYEGYQSWNSEPMKLMPWRNSHWRLQSYPGQQQPVRSGSDPGSAFPGRFDENSIAIPSTLQPGPQNPLESEPGRDIANTAMNMSMPLHENIPVPILSNGAFTHADTLPGPASEAHLAERPAGDAINHQDDLAIEGGTISISSVYSEGLLNSLTHALQSAGVDLSQANIAVQINLGKRANAVSTSGISTAKDPENPMPSGNHTVRHFRDASNNEDLDQSHKRLRI